jgi:uncharacterized ion transporter superfamily protein YfcC
MMLVTGGCFCIVQKTMFLDAGPKGRSGSQIKKHDERNKKKQSVEVLFYCFMISNIYQHCGDESISCCIGLVILLVLWELY